MKSKPYLDHPSWNAWNISLWINNDEGLYRLACSYARHYDRATAAQRMLEDLNSSGVTKTPDGAPYTKTNIMRAMVGM